MKRLTILILAILFLLITAELFAQTKEEKVTDVPDTVTNVTEQPAEILLKEYTEKLEQVNSLLKEVRVRIYLFQKDEKKLEELIEIYSSTITNIKKSLNNKKQR